MRIAVDARPLAQPKTGIGRYTGEVLRNLARLENHQWFLYSTAPIPLQWQAQIGTSIRTTSASSAVTGILKSQIVYKRWCDQDKIDLFWSPRHQLPLTGLKCRTVLTIHDLVWRTYPQTMPLARRLLEKAFTPASLHLADIIIAVSESTAADIIKLYPQMKKKIKVVHEASNLQALQATSDNSYIDEPEFMLCVGTIEPRKNINMLLRAYAEAIQKSNAVPRLKIVGGHGWLCDRVPDMLKQLNLEASVDYLEHCDDALLANLYKHSLFLVHPALYEGFALPILEAMSFGKPIITSNRSAMPEVAGPGGILVDPTSRLEIAAAIIRMSEDEQLRQQLGKAGLEHSRNFSWSKAALQTLEHFNAAMSRKA